MRGEYEIVSAINLMIEDHKFLNAGFKKSLIWMDTGSMDGLLNASSLVSIIEKVTGRTIGSPSLELLKKGLLSKTTFLKILSSKKGQYADNLRQEVSSI